MAKIVVLSSHAESLLVFRSEMLSALAKNNQVIACAPNANPEIINKLQTLGVAYQPLNIARTGLNPVIDLVSMFKIYKFLRAAQPDIFFSYGAKAVIFGSIAASLARVKAIYSTITGVGSYFIHTDVKSVLIRNIMMRLYTSALKTNTKVFFQNPDDIAEFANLKIFKDPQRTVLINGSGVNLTTFAQQLLPTNSISFLLITRFIKAKGLLEYLAAASILKQTYPQLRFLLVGWFETKDEAIRPETLQPYIDSGVIEYLGKLDDVRPAIAQASVYVLPSYREGTPKSVLEAMASGRAIITTDVPGCRETVINGENGFLVPAKDVDALVDAMRKFIDNQDLLRNMGQRSREIAEQKYDVHMVNQAIITAMGCSYV